MSEKTSMLSCCPDSTMPRPPRTADSKLSLRSRGRCTTCRACRLRRVKCDKNQPQCGACTRLGLRCTWFPKWKFSDCTSKIHGIYNDAGLTARDALEVSSRHGHELLASRPISDSSENDTLHHYEALLEDSSHEQQILTCPPGTFNIILTPEDFELELAQAPIDGDTSDDSPEPWLSLTTHSETQQDTPKDCLNVSEYSDLEVVPWNFDTDNLTHLVEKRQSEIWLLSPYSANTYIDNGTRIGDGKRHLRYYENIVCKRIMPFAIKHRLSNGRDGKDLLVTSAKNFPPLYHAICAITLLSSALRGQPNLLAAAFRHYDQAISACWDYTNVHSSQFFYLHYLLLLHDVCCVNMGWPHDPEAVSQHLRQLFKIAQNQPRNTWSVLQATMSRVLLLSDAQSCLVGKEDAGSYVRAFQANGSSLPQEDFDKSFTGETGDIRGAHYLSDRMCRITAEFSQVVLSMQEAYRNGLVEIEELEQNISELTRSLEWVWLTTCPKSLQWDSDAIALLPPLARWRLTFAQLQYAGIMLYLHNCIYPQQRKYSSRYREQDADFCTFIIAQSLTAIEKQELDTINLAALVHAGFCSDLEHERALAVGLLQNLQDSFLSCVSQSSLRHLKLMQEKQSGGMFEEVEWSDVVEVQPPAMFGMLYI